MVQAGDIDETATGHDHRNLEIFRYYYRRRSNHPKRLILFLFSFHLSTQSTFNTKQRQKNTL
jgi:hypothetical protein